jgi:SAM-dependent methyltransferase
MTAELYNASYGALQSREDWYQKLCFEMRAKVVLRAVRPQHDHKILEIGSNDGKLLERIRWHAFDARGIDINREATKNCDWTVSCMDARNLQCRDGHFDKIYCCHVLEHIEELAKVFHEVWRVLKPGGRFVALYPWEPIRGLRALRDAIRLGKGWDYARRLHAHRLTPERLMSFASCVPWCRVESKMVFTPLPDYLTIFEK